MRQENKIYTAFIVSPFIPAILIYIFISLVAPTPGAYEQWWLQTFLFVSVFVGYLIVLIIMVPTYLIFQKLKIFSILSYIGAGSLGGALGLYVATNGTPSIQGYLGPMIWGALSATIFWFIVRPDKAHITRHSS